MVTVIGICAGQILDFLESHEGKASIGVLFEKINSHYVIILMALGWLAREGHVRVHGANPSKMYGADFLKTNISLQKTSKESNGQN